MGTMLKSMAKSPDTSKRPKVRGGAVHPRESVVFFRSYGFYSPVGKCWHLNIHGSIFAPTRRHIRKHVLLRLFKTIVKPENDAQIKRRFRDRADLFLNVSKANKSVPIAIAENSVVLPKSARNGHFTTTLTIPEDVLSPSINTDEFGRQFIRFCAYLPEEDARMFSGAIELIQPTGLSVISDIDDTIKITNVADRRELLANTFTREFQAVPGMCPIYQNLARSGVSFHYVSSSPWPLYQPMVDWLDQDDFPIGSLHLRNMRLSELRRDWKRQRAFESKKITIERLLRDFPHRHFVLCGDSGERDTELYAEVAGNFGGQVHHIAIRYIENGHTNQTRDKISKTLKAIPDSRRTIFTSPEELPEFWPIK